MSLLDLLLAEPSAADKALSVLSMMEGGQRPSGLSSGMGGGSVRPYQGNAAPIALANRIAQKLENRGFQVSGLEGFQGTGQISTGHIPDSQHYTGHAGDVTYGGDGRWNSQNAALDWAEQWLMDRFGDRITELLWEEPDHYDHLHYGTRPGG